MKKHIFTAALIMAIAASVAVVGYRPVLAQVQASAVPNVMVINVGNGGKTLVRGFLVAPTGTTTANTLQVRSWGVVFTVDFSGAEIAGTTKDPSYFKTGDFIGVSGMMNAGQPLVITADVVRDWSSKAVTGIKPLAVPEATIVPNMVQGSTTSSSVASTSAGTAATGTVSANTSLNSSGVIQTASPVTSSAADTYSSESMTTGANRGPSR